MKCPCQHCSAQLEFEAVHVGEAIKCPHCNLETVLLFAGPNIAERAALLRLRHLRKNSCYRLVRILIEVLFGLGVAASVLWTILGIGNGGDSWMFFYVFVELIALVSLFAARQFALLIVDIADTLLDDHAAKKETPRESPEAPPAVSRS